MKKQLMAILLIALAILYGCKPEQGDIGPQGAQGPSGLVGDKGVSGDKGAFGAFISPWREIKPTDWKPWTNGYPNSYTHVFVENKLTTEIIDKGLILGYYRVVSDDDNNHVFPLPDETPNYSADYITFTSGQDRGIQFNVKFRSAAVVNPNMEDWNIKVRWILVPPAATGRLGTIDWKDYEEVKRAFDLKD